VCFRVGSVSSRVKQHFDLIRFDLNRIAPQ